MPRSIYEDDDEDSVQPEQVQDDGEIDALDAYMMGIEEEQRKQDQQKKSKPEEEMFENEDPIEEQYAQFKKQLQDDEEARQFLDSDGDPDIDGINTTKKKRQILVAPDHGSINYRQIQRNFYEEHEEIEKLTAQEVEKIRKEFQINVKGKEVPKPIISFGHLNFDQALMDKISAQEFTKPTPIQSQALPVLLSGRNLIGIAKTGSGKTVAYVWPMLVHILDQPQVTVKQGPIAVVILPTRELGQQVYIETRKYCAPLNISVAAVLGGENKHYQWKELRQGVDIIIATPGRLIELIRKKATNMLRCTYVVVDEADSLFSLGFEQQIKSILDQIRPDRQISLFTATMKKKLKQLCVDQMQDPIVITIGSENNQVNEDIKQECVIIYEEDRLKWLLKNLNECLDRGKVLIFVSQIGQCEELAQQLKLQMGIFALTMHGDKLQQERTQIINSFKAKSQLMIATDVASRGLDVKEIRTVINLYPPKNADIYIHRIGRTGRAGNHDGVAFTLLTNTDSWLAILLIKNLELAGQVVPQPLEDIAQLDSSFKMDRMKKKLGFDYAKGKDASRMLQQALKRQRNTRAGLGFDEQEPDNKKKVKLSQPPPPPKPIVQLPVSFQPATAVSNQFKNRWGDINPYENLTSYAATVNKEVTERDEVIKIFQAKQRENFRAGFKSAGQAEPTTKKPTIKYIDNNK